MKLLSLILCSVAILMATSCAPTRFVEPLPQGRLAATASLGGPLISYSGLVIPTPLTTVAMGYGLTGTETAFGALHLTSALFKDVQGELGIVHRFMAPDGWLPGLSASYVLNLAEATRDNSFKLWPQLDVNGYWHYGASQNVVYVGLSNWWELSNTRNDGEPQTRHWLPAIEVGHVFTGATWSYTTELKYLSPGVANEPNAVGYHGIGGNGTFGVYIGLTRSF